MKLISFLTLFVLSSCSTYKTRNMVSETEVVFKGGVYHEKQWNDSLDFTRYSWYRDSTVNYELLVAKLDKGSPFADWLEKARLEVSRCDNFYVALLYANAGAQHGTTIMSSRLKDAGMEERIILDFSRHVKAHQNFMDWNLDRHKVLGFCKKTPDSKKVEIHLPGYKTIKF